MLTAVLFLLLASTALIAGLSAVALGETRASRIDTHAKQAYFLAEAGVEDVSWRLRNGKQYDAAEAVVLDGSQATVSVASGTNTKTVSATGAISTAVRRATVTLQSGAGGAFHYGVQVGAGGLIMENASRVVGNVYSNGAITGTGSAEITGDALAVTSIALTGGRIGGNAQAYAIAGSTIGGNATTSGFITQDTINGNAVADQASASTVGGTLTYCSSQAANTIGVPPPINSCPAPPGLPVIPYPISDQEIDKWESDAAAGGTIASPCPYQPATGSSIGPRVIACDVIIDGTKVVTLTGPLWIQGNFTMKNSAQLQLAASFCSAGPTSGIVVVSNPQNLDTSSKVSVENSAQIVGCGSGSYIMVVSRNRSAELGGGEVAIDVKNSSNAPIYYAPHGEIQIQNNANLKEATAYRLRIKNSAVVTYESGLAGVTFSSGPSGGWEIRSWNEVE